MPIDITINNISGSTPFDVYVCDTGMTSCVYVSTINSGDLPYTFEVPIIYANSTEFNLRVVDNNQCQINEIITIFWNYFIVLLLTKYFFHLIFLEC